MSLTPRCYRCDAPESAANPLEHNSRVVAGLMLPPRTYCRNVAACLARRCEPPATYSEAHRAVVAARKQRHS